MVLKKKNTEIQKIDALELHEDCLAIEFRVKGIKFKLITVYFSSNDNNDNLGKIINKYIEDQHQPVLIVGDFNAHTGLLGERNNKNGNLLENIIEKNNLTMLNKTPDCEGKITWEARGLKSAIDYAITNRQMFKYYKNMKIDEMKHKFDLSDHCLTEVNLEMNTSKGPVEQENLTEVNCFTQERMEKFNRDVKNDLRTIENEEINMELIDKIIETAANKNLKRKMKRKRGIKKDKGQYEPIWINADIKKEIKLRKKYNRLKRNNLNKQVEEKFNKMYKLQKEKVKNKIKEETYKHEKKITDEIKKDKNKKLWENINYLRGKNKNKNRNTDIYRTDGTKMDREEADEEIKKFWKTIYQKNENRIEETWTRTKEDYERSMENEQITIEDYTFPYQLQEHIDGAMHIPPENQFIRPMSTPKISAKELKTQLDKMKNKKAPGQNRLQIELYKAAAQDEQCLEKMAIGLENTIKNDQIPVSWKSSITKLIAKNKKPTVKDFRPIALTDCSYKICMGIIKSKIESHLGSNNLDNDHQFGFMPKRRTMDSAYILSCIIEKSYKSKETLIITSIDFRKAFDSVNRDKLLEVMTKYKIHPKVIDLIINIYKEDSTTVTQNNRTIDKISIRSGIRQGCNGSTVLFLMVTYLIIEEITKLNIHIKLNGINVATLFFADDGILLSNNINSAQTALNKLEEIGKVCGLEINKEKSSHLINLNKDNVGEIGNIRVGSQIKYLGIEINEGKNCFREHKRKKLTKAKEMANMIMAVIARSSNKILIGKTYWKNVALAEIMYGAEIITYNKNEIEQLQKTENQAYRQMLGTPRYTPSCTLRGEIGSSEMASRDKTTKPNFMKHILSSENDMLREIAELDFQNKLTKFTKTTQKYMNEVMLKLYVNYSIISFQIKLLT